LCAPGWPFKVSPEMAPQGSPGSCDVCQVCPPSWALGKEVEDFEEGMPAFVHLARQLEKEILGMSLSDSTECSSTGESIELASMDHDSGGYGDNFKRSSLCMTSPAASPGNGVHKIFQPMSEVLQEFAASLVGIGEDRCAGDAEEHGEGAGRGHAALGENRGHGEHHVHGETSPAGSEYDSNDELYPLFFTQPGHPVSCAPCTFFGTKRGCRNKATCTRCHDEEHLQQRKAYLRSRQRKRQRNRNITPGDGSLVGDILHSRAFPSYEIYI